MSLFKFVCVDLHDARQQMSPHFGTPSVPNHSKSVTGVATWQSVQQVWPQLYIDTLGGAVFAFSYAAFTPDTIPALGASCFIVNSKYRHELRSCGAIWALAAMQRLSFGHMTFVVSWSKGRKMYPIWLLDARNFVLNFHPSSELTGAAGLPETVLISVGRRHPGKVASDQQHLRSGQTLGGGVHYSSSSSDSLTEWQPVPGVPRLNPTVTCTVSCNLA